LDLGAGNNFFNGAGVVGAGVCFPRRGWQGGKIDIPQSAGLPRVGHEGPDDLRCQSGGSIVRSVIDARGAIDRLRKGNRGNPGQSALHGRRHCPAVGDILAQVRASVHTGKDEVWSMLRHDMCQCHHDAVGRRPVDAESALTQFAYSQRSRQRQGMRRPGVLFQGGNGPDVVRDRSRELFKDLEARSENTVIVVSRIRIAERWLGGTAGASKCGD